jgi:hypothetical protein
MPRRDYDDMDDRYNDRDHRDDVRREDRYSRREDRYSRRDDRRSRRYDDDDDDDYDYGRRRWREPHRGALILILGICGLMVCILCAPAAWIMGSQDLAKISAGTMDPEGYGSTQAGYVLGIIGTVLFLGIVAFFCVVFGLVGAKA